MIIKIMSFNKTKNYKDTIKLFFRGKTKEELESGFDHRLF